MAVLASPVDIAPYSSDFADRHRPSRQMHSRGAGLATYLNSRSTENAAARRSFMRPSTTDSSDDEELAPIKLSAEAQAILGEDSLKPAPDQENIAPHSFGIDVVKDSLVKSNRRLWTSEDRAMTAEDGSPAPRVMRVAGSRPSPPRTLARDGSFMYKVHEKSTARAGLQDSNTPAPGLRRIRISGSRNHTRSPPSSSKSGSAEKSDKSASQENRQEETEGLDRVNDEHRSAYPATILRPRHGEDGGVHSTMRVRRIGTGTLLNGPIRRGMIRRQSDDDNEHLNDTPVDQGKTPEVEHGRRAKEPDLEDLPGETPFLYGSPKQPKRSPPKEHLIITEPKRHSPRAEIVSNVEQSPILQQHVLSTSISRSNPTPGLSTSHASSKSSSSSRRPVFKIPSLPPLESAHDQENEPPPTFKRNKASAPLLQIHEDHQEPASIEFKPQPVIQQRPERQQESPSRQPLAARSNNTPHRAAPAPPPKMSLIDAATSAGASSRSKKSVHYILNGRTYRRLDCIGRGGSSRVFRIMAENYKIFALKRVNLDEADMAAIAGYKGEIDLLKKLGNVDRVIRLFDYEVNEDKGVLSVMMELGESDFNKMLNEQLKGENAKLDVTFTRHYWKEMLECVKAVHDHGVVHSDLKPANFLLVKGQLKLIDFGIAGAIQDNTVNVHRENQIGTPNYMSPESLVCHTPTTGQPAGTKLLKLGKPSDVWSLGCILYQMTYGQPPFAHITKQFERIMSIPNPKVEIQFPGIGIGGAVVPFGLIKTLRRCLQRDQTLRPTIAELLADSDPFLHPVAISPEMLGRVIGNVVGHCRKREEKLKEEGKLQIEDGLSILPRDDEMRGWPAAFYEKLREAGREGTAW